MDKKPAAKKRVVKFVEDLGDPNSKWARFLTGAGVAAGLIKKVAQIAKPLLELIKNKIGG